MHFWDAFCVSTPELSEFISMKHEKGGAQLGEIAVWLCIVIAVAAAAAAGAAAFFLGVTHRKTRRKQL